jgi:DNA-directed RNA polymerase specialized sigma24 family protein
VEDVLQEVFLKIRMHRGKHAAVEHPKAYIVRIVSNESANYLRRMAREKRLFGAGGSAGGHAAASVGHAVALGATAGALAAASEAYAAPSVETNRPS